ncbi:hypothetical protein J4E93_001104 [Alternaria ventricosa]|uniref:uncharacterized protein n=1 Tax=Alternaria ventricosa TaxID=1187951 RepID=UPI0020C561A5|nr:uncharacterized protein J4E93_001104 [Alternaria ventricosa]KAI4653341.1 hypothetical protein J4E93_001104 [Alternaria ventricosa]
MSTAYSLKCTYLKASVTKPKMVEGKTNNAEVLREIPNMNEMLEGREYWEWTRHTNLSEKEIKEFQNEDGGLHHLEVRSTSEIEEAKAERVAGKHKDGNQRNKNELEDEFDDVADEPKVWTTINLYEAWEPSKKEAHERYAAVFANHKSDKVQSSG